MNSIASGGSSSPLNLGNASLGGVLTLNTVTVTFSGITHSGATITGGTVTISASSASLNLGGAVTSTLGTVTGSYDVTNHKFSLTLNSISIAFSSFVNISADSASVTYDSSATTTVNLTDGTTSTGTKSVSVLTVGINNATIFAGVNGPTSNSNAMGVQLSGASLALALMSASDGTTYYGIKTTAGSLSAVGLPSGFTASASDLEVNVNGSTDGNNVVNFDTSFTPGTGLTVATGPSSSIDLDFTRGLIQASGTIDLNFNGFIYIHGNMAFQTGGTTTVHLTGAGTKTVSVLMVGASDVTIFAGVNGPSSNSTAAGIELANAGFALALFKPTSPSDTSVYYGLRSTAGSLSAIGLPSGVTMSAGDLSVEINSSNSSGHVVDFTQLSGGKLTVPTGPSSSEDLTFSQPIIDVQGTLTLDVTDYIHVTGSFGFTQTGTELDINVGHTAFTGATDVNFILGSVSQPFFSATASLSLKITPSSFSILSASLNVNALTLGSFLSVDKPSVSLSYVNIDRATGAITSAVDSHGVVQNPDLTITAASASLFPGNATFTATVSATPSGDGLGLQGVFNLQTHAFSITLEQFHLAVSTFMTADASNILITYDPTNGDPHQQLVAIGEGSVAFAEFGISGSLTNLTIYADGFHFDSLTLSSNNDINLGSVLTISKPSLTLTDFGFINSSVTFSGSISVHVDSATLNVGSAFTASATDLTITVNLGNTNFGALNITAGSLTLEFASVISVVGTDISINTQPDVGQDYLSVGSATVSLSLGNSFSLSGTATDFSLRNTGGTPALHEGPNFGVTISATATDLHLPTWLGFQVQKFEIQWDNFVTDPAAFKLILSASVTSIQGLPSNVTVSGSITDAVIDFGKLETGDFPITSIGSFGGSISGNLFGMQVNASFVIGVVKFNAEGGVVNADGSVINANGTVTATGGDTVVAGSTIYVGLSGGASIAGLGGVQIYLGFSDLGPLTFYINATFPLLLDPDTGLAIGGFSAGISFSQTIAVPGGPEDLPTVTASITPNAVDISKWQQQLQLQTIAQYHATSGGTDPSAQYNQPFVIMAGITLYDAYLTQHTFEITGNIAIGIDPTNPKAVTILLSGTATFGDSISFNGYLYAGIDGNPGATTPLTLMFLLDTPGNIESFGGSISFSFLNQPTLTHNPDGSFSTSSQLTSGFSITVTGFAQYSAAGALTARVEGSVMLTVTLTTATLDLQGDLTVTGLGELATAQGELVLDYTNPNSIQFYGAIRLATGQGLAKLESVGLYANGAVTFQINTTGQNQTVVLPSPTTTLPDVNFPGDGTTFNISGSTIFEVSITGVTNGTFATVDYKIGSDTIFEMQGAFDLNINTTGLQLFANINSLQVGPSGAPFVTFSGYGLFVINSQGFAAEMTLALTAGTSADFGNGISLTANFTLVMNTTSADVIYNIPSNLPPVTIPGTTTMVTTLTIPRGPPQGLLQSDGTFASIGAAGPYLVITGNGTLDITFASASLAFNGFFRFELSDSASGPLVSLVIQMSCSTTGQSNLSGLVVEGALQISSDGVVALLEIGGGVQQHTDYGSGVTLDALFELALNTTGSPVSQIGGINLTTPSGATLTIPADSFSIIASGTLALSIDGTGFLITGSIFASQISTTLTTIAVSGTLTATIGGQTILTMQANGAIVVDTDSSPGHHPGIAGELSLTFSANNPLSGTGFVFNGSFDLQLNTTLFSRSVPDPGGGPDITIAAGPNNSSTGALYIEVHANGTLAFGTASTGFLLAGDFYLSISSIGFAVSTDVTFNAVLNGTTLMTLNASGALQITSDGIAASFTLTIGSGSPFSGSGFSFSGSFQLQVNTTPSFIHQIGSTVVDLPQGPYFQLSVTGSIAIGTGTGLSLDGGFVMTISSTGLAVTATATLNVVIASHTFFTLTANGALLITSQGVAAKITLTFGTGSALPGDSLFSFSGSFLLALNTTPNPVNTINNVTVSLPGGFFLQIQGTAHLSLLSGFIDIYGSFNFTIQGSNITIDIAASASILGIGFSVAGHANLSSSGLVLFVVLKLGTNDNPVVGIGGIFSIQGTFVLEVNTTGVTQSATLNIGGTPTPFSIDGSVTLKVQVQNASLFVLGFQFTGNLTFLIQNGIFTIINSTISLNFFDFFSLTVTINYLDSTGKFNLHAHANIVNFGNDFFGISASVDLQFANYNYINHTSTFIFRIEFIGSVHVLGIGASIDAFVFIDGSSVELSVTVTLDFWLFSVSIGVDIHLGSTAGAPTPPPPPLAIVQNGVLTLYLGNNVGSRGVPAQTNENYQITSVTSWDGTSQDVSVYAPGITSLAQTFNGVSSIVADSGGTSSNTLIQIANDVQAGVTITASSGTNQFLMGGGPSTITGTNGNDTVTGGSGSVTFHAGSGSSVFIGGNGTNVHNIIYDPGTVRIIETGYHNYSLSGSTLTYDGNVDELHGTFNITLASASTGAATFLVSNCPQTVTLDANGNPGATATVVLDGNLTLTGAAIAESNGGSILLENTVQPTVLPSLELDGGPGANTFTINSWSGTTPLVLDGKDGGDTFKVNFIGSGNYTVHVQDTGASGVDALIVNGTLNSDTLTIGANSISRASETVTYAGVESITINTLNGDDTVNINNPSAAIVVNGGNGTDTFNVPSTAQAVTINTGTGTNVINVGSGSRLNNIQAQLTVNGSIGGTSTVNLDDSADPSARTVVLTSTTLTGVFGANGSFAYSRLTTLNLYLGSHGNTLTIVGTGSDTTNVTTGNGNDTVSILGVTGILNVNLNGGTNTVNIGSTAPDSGGSLTSLNGIVNLTGNGNDVMNVDDSGSFTPESGALRPAQLTFLDPVTINFTGFSVMNISFSQVNDLFAVVDTFTSSSTTPVIVLDGNGGDDTFIIFDTHAVMTVNGDDGNDNFYNFGNSSVLYLNGNAGDDTFYIYASVSENTSNVNPGAADSNGNQIYSYRVNAPVFIDGGTGNDKVFIYATVLNDVITINGTQVTGAGINVTFTNIEQLTVAGLGGDDTFYIESITIPTTVIGDGTIVLPQVADFLNALGLTLPDLTGGAPPATSFNDTFYVAWRGQSYIPGQLSVISAPLTLQGNEGTDTAYVDDSGDSANRNFTLDATSLMSDAFGTGGVIYYDNTVDNLNIKAGAGDDNITINGTGAGLQTTIYGGPGNDHFVVNDDPLTSPLAIIGDSNTFPGDTLTINGANGGNNFVVTGFTVDGAGATISYATIELLTINAGGATNFTVNGDSIPTYLNGGSGNDSFTVNGSSTPLFIDGGDGNDTVTINGNSGALTATGGANNDTFLVNGGSGGLSLNGGAGNDTFIINSLSSPATLNGGTGDDSFTVNAPLAASPTINGGGDAGDTLTVNGTVGNDFWVITGNTVGGIGATINYSAVNSLIINGISGNDVFNVRSTSVTTTLNTGTGINTVNVGSTQPVSGGILDNVQGALIVVGNGNDSLNVDDTGSTLGKTGTLTGSTLTGLGTAGITFSGIAVLNISLGSGDDTLTIANTPSAPTTINGDGGNDTFNVQATTGVTNLNGGAGNDTFNLGSLAPATGGNVNAIAGQLNIDGGSNNLIAIYSGNGDVVNVDDTGDVSNNTGTLTSTTLTGLGMTVGVTYTGVEALNMNLGSGDDTFNIQGTTSIALTVLNTGAGANTINIGSNAPSSSGVLVNIQGPIVVIGSGHDTMNVDDTGSTVDDSGWLLDMAPLPYLGIGPTIVGLGMGAGLFSGVGITYAGLGYLNISLGTGNDTFTINEMTYSTVTTIDGGPGNNNAILNFSGNFAAQELTLLNFQNATLYVGGSFSGLLNDAGAIDPATIVGAFTSTAQLNAGSVGTMTVGGDLAGVLNVTGLLDSLAIGGGSPGKIIAGDIHIITVQAGYGNKVFQVIEGGVERQIQATPVGGGLMPDTVHFAFVYDSETATVPQLSIRITNTAPVPHSFDLSLVVYSATAQFNLARVDADGHSGVSNITVEGNILTAVSQPALDFFSLDVGSLSGVVLPTDNITGVEVRDVMPFGQIHVGGIEGIAFGVFLGKNGKPMSFVSEFGMDLSPSSLANLLGSHATLLPATDTFKVPFGENHKVTLYAEGDQDLDLDLVATFTDQIVDDASVTAFVRLQTPIGRLENPPVQSIYLRGDGGSVFTNSSVGGIISTGALGDVTVGGANGLGSITAPSIFGNIRVTYAGITGIIQTTGIRIDPITGDQMNVSADIGQFVFAPNGRLTGVTGIYAKTGISGQIICRGNLVSTVKTDGAFTGVIAAQGDIGTIQRDNGGNPVVKPAGQLSRFGGVTVKSNDSGQIIALGNILGNVTVGGTMTGRIAAEGQAVAGLAASRFGILGNVKINSFALGSAILSGGIMGDATGKTLISVGKAKGFLGAEGNINLAKSSKIAASNVFKNAQSNASGPALAAIFTNGALPLLFDTGGVLHGLALIESDLGAITISGGTLTGTAP